MNSLNKFIQTSKSKQACQTIKEITFRIYKSKNTLLRIFPNLEGSRFSRIQHKGKVILKRYWASCIKKKMLDFIQKQTGNCVKMCMLKSPPELPLEVDQVMLASAKIPKLALLLKSVFRDWPAGKLPEEFQ